MAACASSTPASGARSLSSTFRSDSGKPKRRWSSRIGDVRDPAQGSVLVRHHRALVQFLVQSFTQAVAVIVVTGFIPARQRVQMARRICRWA